MSARSDAAITAAGIALGAAIVGIPAGILLARHLRTTTPPAKPYSQTDTTVTSITNLRKGAGK